MMKARKTGYAFHGKKTPTLKEQEDALLDLGCEVVFTDKSPARTERSAMINAGLMEGDLLVICGEYALGSGEADAAKVVAQVCELGVKIQVMDQEPVLYKTEESIAAFASRALKSSRKFNAIRTSATRVRSGRRGKLDDLSDAEWVFVKFWWARAARQQDVVDFCNGPLGCEGVTRVNISHKIKAELMAGKSNDL